jgi:hypothetical protein
MLDLMIFELGEESEVGSKVQPQAQDLPDQEYVPSPQPAIQLCHFWIEM